MKMNKKNIIVLILLSIAFTMCVEDHVLPKFGHVKITSDPIGAEIYKNGVTTGEITPANFDELLSGSYNFSLRLSSFVDTTFLVQLNEGQEYSQNIFLTESTPLGKITLTSTPVGAKVFFDGKDTGKKTPTTFDKLQRGDFEFTLKLNLYEDHNVNINLSQNETIQRNTKLLIAGSAGSLFVTSNPIGAAIILDGNETGLVTPDTLVPVSAGQHSIKFSLENYRDTTITTTVVAGLLVEEFVNLTFYEPRGSMTINSNPQGAKIFINNSDTELVTPNTISKIEAGNYSIKLVLENYYDSTFTVTVVEDQNTNVGTISLVKIPIYKITASSNPSGASNISGDGEYSHGDEVTITTEPNAGYQFINWTEGGSEVSTSLTYTFTANKDRNLIANYNQIGNLKVNSNPEGASIYLNSEFTGHKTPHTFENILAGQYILTLKLKDFADTTQTILVNRNQTTNVGPIFLRDIVPSVQVDLKYKDDSGRIIFVFSFNQDITLNKVDFTKPDGTTLTQNYGGQSVPKGREIELPYPEKINGTWQFEFFGNKAGGRKAAFDVIKSLLVN